MISSLSPQDRDRRATLVAEGRPIEDEQSESGQSTLWLWGIVGVIVLIAFASGAFAGFFGGRLSQRPNNDVPQGIEHWLLGAGLADSGDGITLEFIHPQGPAAAAGLGEADRLRAIAGSQPRDAAHVRELLSAYARGDVVRVEVSQGYRVRQVSVTLGVFGATYVEPVPTPVVVTVVPPPNTTQSARLGVFYRMLKPGDPFAVKNGALIVAFLADQTPASAAGLQPGDIITLVGSQPISESMPLDQALAGYAANSTIQLEINREGQPFTVTVR